MKIELLNLKEEIRKIVLTKFVIREKRSLIIEIENFLNFMYGIKEKHNAKYNLFIGALIGDSYEILKWKETLGVCHERENALLHHMDSSKTFDEVVNVCLDVEFVSLFLTNVYCKDDLPLCDKVSAKNNIVNVKTNSVIMDADKLKVFDDFSFYNRKLIFSKDYQKEEYLNLYNQIKDEKHCIDGYIDIIYGMSLYNQNNYQRVVLDMCLEFFAQKHVIDDVKKLCCEEDYLLYLIKYADVERLINVITENRFMIIPLVYSYANYNCFNEETKEQVDQVKTKPKSQKVYRKLNIDNIDK